MHRIRPDSPTLATTALVLTGIVAASSFTVSFTGLMAAAAWAGLPQLLRPAVPVVVDSSILVFTVAAVVQRSRGESTRLAWSAVAFFTSLSVLVNAVHAHTGTTLARPAEAIIGIVLAGVMPIACFIATHTITDLLVSPPQGSLRQRQRAERLRQQHAQTPPAGKLIDAARQLPPAADSQPAARNRVSAEQVHRLAGLGRSQRAIAQELGTSKSTVARILKDQVPAEAG